MNMMTAMPATLDRRLAPTMPELMHRIDIALSLSSEAPTRFGINANCGKNAIADIRAGRRHPRAAVRLRLLDHAEELIAFARQRALVTLLAIDRRSVATTIDSLIEMLDEREGDPDLEPNGDEQDGSRAEDDFCQHNLSYGGPGCPVSDGGCSTGSGAGDPSWTEWHSRGSHKLGSNGEERCRRIDGNMAHDDDEDDDPIEANGDERDTLDAEDDELSSAAKLAAHCWHDGPGCYLADIPEPSMGAPEACGGRWQGEMGSNTDQEPWFVPSSLNPPIAANEP